MITPSAPPAGTVTFAVTEWDLFLTVSTDASVMRMPGNNVWLVPVTSCGRPARSGLMRS